MRTPYLLGLLPLLAAPLVAASMADTLVREEWEVGRPSLPADWSQLAILSVCLGLETAAWETVRSGGGSLQNEDLDGQQRED